MRSLASRFTETKSPGTTLEASQSAIGAVRTVPRVERQTLTIAKRRRNSTSASSLSKWSRSRFGPERAAHERLYLHLVDRGDLVIVVEVTDRAGVLRQQEALPVES